MHPDLNTRHSAAAVRLWTQHLWPPAQTAGASGERHRLAHHPLKGQELRL